MKAEDKAKELLWEYLPIIEGWTSKEKTDLAKQCALICVDDEIELLSKINALTIDLKTGLDINIQFLKEVKQEIEKL